MGCHSSKHDEVVDPRNTRPATGAPQQGATRPDAHHTQANGHTSAAKPPTVQEVPPKRQNNAKNDIAPDRHPDSLQSIRDSTFAEQYTLGKKLGSGTFSVVREAVHNATGQRYAVKCIRKEGLSKEDLEALTAEVEILKQMEHPNIMILHDFFSEEKYYYLVTELMEGGELFDRIVQKECYSEKEARDLVKLLLEAIKYCHDRGVVHRDLKPENLLLTSKQDDASIKLADFGFAKRIEFQADNSLSTACGTPGYVAPEILEGKPYGKSVDIWSIGVITYILLCGYPPFHHENHGTLFKLIKRGKYEFDSPYWDNISEDAKNLISRMLVTDPTKRATAEQLLQHVWLSGSEVATVHLTGALEELKRFNARRRFKAAVTMVTATNRLKQGLSIGESVTTSPEAVGEAAPGQISIELDETPHTTVQPPQAQA